MKIIETEINDIQKIELNELKLKLADKIIESFSPILDKDHHNKIKEIKKLKDEIEIKKKTIISEKIELEKINQELNKKKKEQVFLSRVSKLVLGGLIQESMKSELIVLLKSFKSMSDEKINNYLNESMKIISKRFAKK